VVRGGPRAGPRVRHAAVETDFARRCLLAGLAHVAADDVLVGHLGSARGEGEPGAEVVVPTADAERPTPADEREPPAGGPDGVAALAASSVLPRALRAARGGESLPVTLDLRALAGEVTGTQRHILELAAALAATGRLRLRLLVAPDTRPDALRALRALSGVELLPAAALDAGTPRTAVFHRPHQVFEAEDLRHALRLGERIVLSQLDLIAYRNPGYHASHAAWQRHRRVTREALAAADRVVVSSAHTRHELLADELLDEERVRIVPPGLDHGAVSLPEGAQESEPGESERAPGDAAAGGGPRLDAPALEEPPGFLVCLGTDFTHKNRLFALRLLAALRARHGWHGRLVLAGAHVPHGSSREAERELLRRDPALRAAVVELGSVEEAERRWLLAHAAAVLYPSTYEGFGLIPFEAALAGTPCAFAPHASLAEVLPAEAAAIVPWDPQESAARVHALLSDAHARERHLHAIERAARPLTWARAAAAMVEIYEEAALAPAREAAALGRDELRREWELQELVLAQEALVSQLDTERRHAQRMYDELHAEVGSGLSLIGPHGALPEDLQRALLAFSARPALSRPLYGALARAFGVLRALAGGLSGGRRRNG
jgi:glycosyltransferase involved in cell wall biosynthesis